MTRCVLPLVLCISLIRPVGAQIWTEDRRPRPHHAAIPVMPRRLDVATTRTAPLPPPASVAMTTATTPTPAMAVAPPPMLTVAPAPMISSPVADGYPPPSHSGYVLEKRETPYSTTYTAFPAQPREEEPQYPYSLEIDAFVPVLPRLPPLVPSGGAPSPKRGTP